jgi:hypothetical protein
MTEPLRYATGRDLLAAVKARAADQTRRQGVPIQQVIRQFVYDRLLARLFHDPSAPWVLKGGNALMTREPDSARASLDLDLAARRAQQRLDSLLHDLEDAAALDIGDHFRFVIVGRREHQGDTQPNVVGYQLTIDAYCGIKKVVTVTIDLVTGTLITGTPEGVARSTLAIDGLDPVVVTVYPMCDHIADKVCATAETHGPLGRASSRVRDLVDLVVIAVTQTVDADGLSRAIRLEWRHRGLPGTPAFDPPRDWAAGYAGLARRTPGCANFMTFEDAVHFVGKDFLGSVLAGQAGGQTWDPTGGIWSGPR